MRRSSYTPQPASLAEPLIVVEESGLTDEEEDNSNSRCSTPQSPSMLNQYLLSPYRDVRKSSLPTPLCTSGITASQVRRLSEHGTDAAPTPREQAFLATLSTAPTQAPGGRRHSVVTISKAPPLNALFGRGRRESIAAFSTGAGAPRILQGGRRDSNSSLLSRAPSTTNLGSQFNLQLDIMDDIAEMKAARKVKLKMWKTPSQEQVCELEAMDGPSTSTGSPVRYHASGEGRRYSEFVPPSSLTIPPAPKRRASEQVARSPSQLNPGIVCTNNDLKSILSSLASSAQEINQPAKESPKHKKPEEQIQPAKKDPPKVVSSVENKRKMMKESRSNSFDVSMLLSTVKVPKAVEKAEKVAPSSWFVRRHLPKKVETEVRQKSNESVQVSCVETKAKAKEVKKELKKEVKKEAGKVLWDEKAGAVVDAQVLGSAIEVFLARRGSGNDSPTTSTSTEGKASTSASSTTGKPGKNGSWFGGGGSATMKDEDKGKGSDTCESTSICSTLKDLFVK